MLLSADPNMTGLLQEEHPKFSSEKRWGAEKSDFWRIKALTRQDRTKVTFITNQDE